MMMKVVNELREKNVKNIKGFFTKEVRDGSGERIGFDIHLLDEENSTGSLARVG